MYRKFKYDLFCKVQRRDRLARTAEQMYTFAQRESIFSFIDQISTARAIWRFVVLAYEQVLCSAHVQHH